MKRQSKAEEALRKQLNNLKMLIQAESAKADSACIQRDAYRNAADMIEQEITRLQNIRLAASKARTTGAL